MLKKWLPSLLGLSALALLGRVAGFFREVLMASKFGANSTTDAYLTTLILFDLAIAANTAIIAGTLSYLSDPNRSAKSHRKSLVKLSLYSMVAGVVISILLFPLVDWILPHLLGTNYAAAHIFSSSVKLLLIFISFVISCGILSAVLQIKGRLSIPGGLTIFLNGFSILSLIFLSNNLGIISIPAGLLAGTILFFIFQFVWASQKPVPQIEENKIKIFPWIFSIILVFGNLLLPSIVTFFERYFAFSMSEGAYSHYSYAVKLGLLPLTIFGYAISTSLLPLQTKFIQESDSEGFKNITAYALLIGLISAGLIITIFFIFAQPLVKILYEHGKFFPADTVSTASVLRIYSFGLFPFLITPILANIFYSLKKTKFLIMIGITTTILNLVLIILSVNIIAGSIAFAIAAVLAGWVNMIISFVFIVRKMSDLINTKIISTGLTIFLITLIFSFTGYYLFDQFISIDQINVLKTIEILPHTIAGIIFVLVANTLILWILIKKDFPGLTLFLKELGNKKR